MAAGGSNSTFKPVTIKKETTLQSNGIDNIGRLSSFNLPRDLTLGGAGPLRGRGATNKKVYTPNLNVVRNKNTNVKTSKDGSARGRNRPERGKSDRGGRGGRGGKSNFIQTSGIFSEGAAVEHYKRASSSYRSSSRTEKEDTSSAAMQKPTLTKTDGRIDVAAEEQHIKDILGERISDDFDDKKTDFFDFENTPVKLSRAKWNTENIKIDESKIKKELIHDGDLEDKINAIKLIQGDAPPHHFKYPLNTEEFFDRSQPQQFLLQLPDSLPCQDEVTDKDNPSTSKENEAQTQSGTQVSSTSSLSNLEEGQIGKLIRYKSGRQKLVLGNTRFDLVLGMEAGFLQEVMSVVTNREERSGNMVNLGPINVKLTATPDWESLFKDNS